MNTRQILVTLTLPLVMVAGPAQAASHRPHGAAIAASSGYQGEAPPWSFACIKDHGPTPCGEPIWIYGN